MKKIAVLASGGGTNFQAIIDGCTNGLIKGKVALLIYNRKDAYAKKRAEHAGIKSVYVNRIAEGSIKAMEQKVYDELISADIDIIVLAGYLEKLSSQVVQKWQNKIINTHPSLIPMFCGEGFYGEKVHKAVIDNGVKVSGCTIHLVDANYDTGPIIMQYAVEVKQDDSPKTLAQRILPHEHECLVSSVSLLCEDRILVNNSRVNIISK